MLFISQYSITVCFGYFGTNTSASEKARRKGTKVHAVHVKDNPMCSPFRKEILAWPLSYTLRATVCWET